jgi:RimJ/RimL family protein N-acetyltransferase
MTTPDYWPLPGLRLRAGGLELRLPDDTDLRALAALAEAGVHDPAVMPFGVPWTDVEPAARALGTMRYHWSCWGSWEPGKWVFNLVVARDSTIVAMQGLTGKDFAALREVSTGSWVGRAYQGQGIGTVMRAAVLSLAFEGLGAEFASSSAFRDNAASLGVSRKLGYVPDGIERQLVRGKPAELVRLRLDRAAWEAHRSVRTEISGLEPCLPLFGLTS